MMENETLRKIDEEISAMLRLRIERSSSLNVTLLRICVLILDCEWVHEDPVGAASDVCN